MYTYDNSYDNIHIGDVYHTAASEPQGSARWRPCALIILYIQ